MTKYHRFVKEHKTGRVIKKGTDDWWLWIAIIQAAERMRHNLNIPKGEPLTLLTDDINKEIDLLNRSMWRRLWTYFTNGNMSEDKRLDALGNEVYVKDD